MTKKSLRKDDIIIYADYNGDYEWVAKVVSQMNTTPIVKDLACIGGIIGNIDPDVECYTHELSKSYDIILNLGKHLASKFETPELYEQWKIDNLEYFI